MERHFQPKKLVLAERFAMMSKAQKIGQTLQEYFAEVQKAANECMFEKVSDVRDAMVTMIFIGGLASVETRKRLLEKEHFTSEEALEVAEAFERVEKKTRCTSKKDNRRWASVQYAPGKCLRDKVLAGAK
ncbi:hypothetical protein ANCCAN_14520 [Ancylostoma caninum]|uniref:Uncharacterized protein n=1 Tax=Ancylostoma caninum TaxID=29170 RepID=A0A368G789_ANCCA|nr:hypothetical protein ANCCAN_14520 [Ancylostoma caninum]